MIPGGDGKYTYLSELPEEDYRRYKNETLRRLSATKKEQPTCMYYRGGNAREHHCTMTTQDTCLRCRFYSPNAMERRRLLVEKVLAAEHERFEAQGEIEVLKAEIADEAMYFAEQGRKHEEEIAHVEALLDMSQDEIKRMKPNARIGAAVVRHRKKVRAMA